MRGIFGKERVLVIRGRVYLAKAWCSWQRRGVVGKSRVWLTKAGCSWQRPGVVDKQEVVEKGALLSIEAWCSYHRDCSYQWRGVVTRGRV